MSFADPGKSVEVLVWADIWKNNTLFLPLLSLKCLRDMSLRDIQVEVLSG